MRYTLTDCAKGVAAGFSRTKRGLVQTGLWLLKAQALHKMSPEERARLGGEAKAKKADGCLVQDLQEAGFAGWLDTLNAGFSERSAYNYIALAEAMQLTADSTEKDVDAIPDEVLARVRIGGASLEEGAKPRRGNGEMYPPKLDPVAEAEQLWLPLWQPVAILTHDSTHGKALWALPLVSSDPHKPGLVQMEADLEHALKLVREIREERERAGRPAGPGRSKR